MQASVILMLKLSGEAINARLFLNTGPGSWHSFLPNIH
jgi:hypothetical protein